MATTVYRNGKGLVTVPAGEKISIFSNGWFNVSQVVGYPNVPSTLVSLSANVAGDTYTSAAFAAETDLEIEVGPSDAFYEVGADPSVYEPQADITAADATFTVTGLAAAQGGYVKTVGGTSSTAGNAGGASISQGGVPGATGVGGAAQVIGGVGGATSGAGGVASVTGGAATTDGAGGAAQLVGGVGVGATAGGAAQVTGGASGAGATGDGGDVSLTGGAAASTNGNGGSIIATPGAKTGSGIAGGVFLRSAGGQIFKQQTAASAESDGNQAITAAQMINGIVVHTVTTGCTLTTPTGAALTAACPADLAAGDSFDLTVITVGAGADDISTLTAGDGDVTFVGRVTVGPSTNSTTDEFGTWRFRYAGTNAWVGYRIG